VEACGLEEAMPNACITGTGRTIPSVCVTNEDLAKRMDTSDEWIRQRTGIQTRYWAADGVSGCDLAAEAAGKAIAAAGLQNDDIEMIVLATLSSDAFFPGTSAFLNARLGLPGVPALDIRCQCTGFLYALTVADQFIRAGVYRRVLLVGVEIHSTGIELSNRGRDVSVLFGDGAGAFVLEAGPEDRGVLSSHLHADGRFAKALWTEAPGSCYHPIRLSKEMMDEGMIYPKMDGRLVFKHAVEKLPQVINEALQYNKLSLEDIDHFVFHQANLRINEFVAKSLGIPEAKVYNNIQKYGNTSAAAIPILLDELVEGGRVQDGQLVLMAGFGSGFTWGSAVVRW
jgi:3-oxoacyl-[acyl-carrier-protein] synthase-3